jgi:acetylornithine deacetylase
VRVTDAYTNEEVVDIIRQHVRSTVTPRSMRLRPSSTPLDHPLVQVAASMGMECYGSPTMSDQSLLPDHIHSVKIGPGNSARSHTPDEYITLQELESGIGTMIALAERFLGVGHEALG